MEVDDDADTDASPPGHQVPSAPPPSPEGALPRGPHVEATWQLQLVRELDRRGIHVPIFSILRRADARRRGPQGQDGDAYRNGGFGAVPASSEAIASLPATTATGAIDDECAVCFEMYEEGDRMRTMPCSHGFHEGCIRKWLRISRLCPLCRFKLEAE